MYIYVHTYIHIYRYTYANLHIHIHIYIHIYIYVYMYIHKHKYIYTHIHTYIHVYINAYIYIYAPALPAPEADQKDSYLYYQSDGGGSRVRGRFLSAADRTTSSLPAPLQVQPKTKQNKDIFLLCSLIFWGGWEGSVQMCVNAGVLCEGLCLGIRNQMQICIKLW